MKLFLNNVLAFLLLLAIMSCGDSKKPNEKIAADEILSESVEEELLEIDLPKDSIQFDVSMDYDEFVEAIIVNDYLKDDPDILFLHQFNYDKGLNDLFFMADDLDEKKFYLLTYQENGFYSLKEVVVGSNSWLKNYGSTTVFFEIHEVLINEMGQNDFIVTAEISGNTEAPDGFRRFKKMQSDVFIIKEDNLEFSSDLTAAYNKNVGNIMEEDTNDDIVTHLYKKHGRNLLKDNPRDAMKDILNDMNIISKSNDNSPNEFQQVESTPEGSYVYQGYEGEMYFVNDSRNSFNYGLENISAYDYPLYLEFAHDSYVYKVDKIDFIEDFIHMDFKLINIASEDEERTMSLGLHRIDEMWVMMDNYGHQFVTAEAGKNLERTDSDDQN